MNVLSSDDIKTLFFLSIFIKLLQLFITQQMVLINEKKIERNSIRCPIFIRHTYLHNRINQKISIYETNLLHLFDHPSVHHVQIYISVYEKFFSNTNFSFIFYF